MYAEQNYHICTQLICSKLVVLTSWPCVVVTHQWRVKVYYNMKSHNDIIVGCCHVTFIVLARLPFVISYTFNDKNHKWNAVDTSIPESRIANANFTQKEHYQDGWTIFLQTIPYTLSTFPIYIHLRILIHVYSDSLPLNLLKYWINNNVQQSHQPWNLKFWWQATLEIATCHCEHSAQW